eukprot:3012166-Rhodomonas_salina.2
MRPGYLRHTASSSRNMKPSIPGPTQAARTSTKVNAKGEERTPTSRLTSLSQPLSTGSEPRGGVARGGGRAGGRGGAKDTGNETMVKSASEREKERRQQRQREQEQEQERERAMEERKREKEMAMASSNALVAKNLSVRYPLPSLPPHSRMRSLVADNTDAATCSQTGVE